MAGLKALRIRIKSVKSTQKITKAMKLVAAAKLRRARENAEAARPYAEAMGAMLASLRNAMPEGAAPRLLAGTGNDSRHLLIVATSDRGLCGAFNNAIIRAARKDIQALTAQGKQVKIFCVGKKVNDIFKREFEGQIVELREGISKAPGYAHAKDIAATVMRRFDANEFDVATLYYNRFISVITQKVTAQKLIPLEISSDAPQAPVQMGYVEYEPSEEEILSKLLPKNLEIQIFRALLENAASEQGARMTAMDSATRNAGEMIKKLTLQYNRSRQATITKELIEIISGAEAI
ncbi:F0F1 ATP synthase subunit gamma [bacterium]|nr:F0F1 ATP synthase subunit gamma [bacterium]